MYYTFLLFFVAILLVKHIKLELLPYLSEWREKEITNLIATYGEAFNKAKCEGTYRSQAVFKEIVQKIGRLRLYFHYLTVTQTAFLAVDHECTWNSFSLNVERVKGYIQHCVTLELYDISCIYYINIKLGA